MSLNIAIWASGNGSNAENIIKYFKDKTDIANIRVIMCNNKNAFVLERAKKYNVPTFVFTYKELNETDMVDKKLEELDIDFIVLSGFMLKVPDSIIRKYADRIVNIHPALLPKFGGKGMYGDHVGLHHAFAAALSTGETSKTAVSYQEVPFVKYLENPTEASWNIPRWLIRHGYSDEEIGKVLGGNALRVLSEVWA